MGVGHVWQIPQNGHLRVRQKYLGLARAQAFVSGGKGWGSTCVSFEGAHQPSAVGIPHADILRPRHQNPPIR